MTKDTCKQAPYNQAAPAQATRRRVAFSPVPDRSMKERLVAPVQKQHPMGTRKKRLSMFIEYCTIKVCKGDCPFSNAALRVCDMFCGEGGVGRGGVN